MMNGFDVAPNCGGAGVRWVLFRVIEVIMVVVPPLSFQGALDISYKSGSMFFVAQVGVFH